MQSKYSPFTHVLGEELQVRIPFVTNDFSAGEAANWNDLS